MRVGYRRRDVTALYRKYRSAVLADLIGQDHIVRTLSNELRAGHVAHAYLFAGIRGTGKTSTARILARAVNCLEPVDGEPPLDHEDRLIGVQPDPAGRVRRRSRVRWVL